MIEVEYVCKECGTINNFIIGNTPINSKFDLSKDNESDFDILNVDCDGCGVAMKIRVEIKIDKGDNDGSV